MLRIQNFRKAYSAEPVLQVSDLSLPDGVYWLRGENGAGKTTLLKSIAGLIPFEGEISVAGINLRRQRQRYTKAVSFAEAEPVFPGFLTGAEMLQFYLQTKGGSEAEAASIARRLGMTSYLGNLLGTYSSGMLKKLSLLLCFCGPSKWLLLDEPFITLDAEAVEHLQTLIGERSSAASFLISSHQELDLPVAFRSLAICQQTIQTDPHATGAA